MIGRVVGLKLDKGFGFIKGDEGINEYFFHRSSLSGIDFQDLKIGQKVNFEEGSNQKGPRAEDVTLV